jgi:hypothetical protein
MKLRARIARAMRPAPEPWIVSEMLVHGSRHRRGDRHPTPGSTLVSRFRLFVWSDGLVTITPERPSA